MYIYRNVPFEIIWRFGWKNIVSFLIYGSLLCVLHHFLLAQYHFHLHIPFALIGPVGVAVAIYASFKNGQSYDRTWEARKNWGALAVSSRIFANHLMMYLSDNTAVDVKIMIDRQIAYLNALKLQLRKRSAHSRDYSRSIQKYHCGEPSDQDWINEVGAKISESEFNEVSLTTNKALQLLFLQHKHLRKLKEQHQLDEYKMMDIMQNLNACFENQGKNERLKTTPFPRQYAYFSRSFIVIFILILPFGILDLYDHYSLFGYAIITLLYALVAWLYITVELVGDFSEDPFENFITDIPMSAIVRNVEIDLYELIKEPEIPKKIDHHQGVLM